MMLKVGFFVRSRSDHPVGLFSDPVHPDRPTTLSHVFWNGRAVCGGRLTRGEFMLGSQPDILTSVACENCKRWVFKNSERIAAGEYR